ncbi:helix-turn-helix domain-containing protein (plasmid) [Methanocaldococcus indicus]|uniref:helix-turn-helix domain-containing protein n=1 Tax=Methanocaldococcus indicus TaxID=213231 RepID=UPI0039C9D6A5
MKKYSAKQVADILGVSPTTILRLIKNGEIKAEISKKFKKSYYYIYEDEVERLKKELCVK